jgi:hypothetical protein
VHPAANETRIKRARHTELIRRPFSNFKCQTPPSKGDLKQLAIFLGNGYKSIKSFNDGVFITPAKNDNNNNNIRILQRESMSRFRIGLIIIAFILSSLLVCPNISASNELNDEKIRKMVASLINAENKVYIQDINIQRSRDGLLDLKIITNFGNCWGKEEFAKGFAKEALKALFSSNLPLSHVILEVQESNGNLMTVALGKNQADNIDWNNADSLEAFYNQIKSRMNYKGNPTDYCWIIEGKPSPGP